MNTGRRATKEQKKPMAIATTSIPLVELRRPKVWTKYLIFIVHHQFLSSGSSGRRVERSQLHGTRRLV